MKKIVVYSLLVLFFFTSGYGTFYCMAKKLFDDAAFELADLNNAEEDQKEEKEEKEKEKEQDKNGYYECFFEYEVEASGVVTGSSYFRDAFNVFPGSDFRTEVFSPPEIAVI